MPHGEGSGHLVGVSLDLRSRPAPTALPLIDKTVEAHDLMVVRVVGCHCQLVEAPEHRVDVLASGPMGT